MMRLGQTDLQVYPLCLGGNVFGWTADEQQSFEVLDAYAAVGGNFVDTADAYSAWVPGHTGGESEAIIGRWMASRGTRQQMVIATKVGSAPGVKGLGAATIRTAADASLARLGVDRIDLYYAHIDDQETPLEETLSAFDGLVKDGKVRYVAASNYSAARLTKALAISNRQVLTPYVALQTHYNLAHRHEYEGDLRSVCLLEHLPCLPYFALARGFLTGKYRPGTRVDSPRAVGAQAYLTEPGLRLLSALDTIASARETTMAAVALAWLKQQPTVVAPIASARTAAQLGELLPMVDLTLSEDELTLLSGSTG
jgi:aryl-alcohol dehydrogenase-like predicted oxidoreductase